MGHPNATARAAPVGWDTRGAGHPWGGRGTVGPSGGGAGGQAAQHGELKYLYSTSASSAVRDTITHSNYNYNTL
jgi:hypothetical protein